MNKALAERMQEAILESGMSQANISRAMSVDPSCITRWKNQKYRPRTKQLQQFADIVGVEVDWLLTGRGKKTDPSRIPTLQKVTNNSGKEEEEMIYQKKYELLMEKHIAMMEENSILKEQFLKKAPLSKTKVS